MSTSLFPTLDIFTVTQTGFIEGMLIVTHSVRRAEKMSARADFPIGIPGKGLV